MKRPKEPARHDRPVFVASRRARVAAALPLEQLGTADWVLNPDGCGFRAKLRQELQRVGAPLRVAIEAYGHEAQLALIARGLGFGLVPARTLARYPERARLQTFRVKGHDLRVTVWNARGRPREALRPVLDALDADLLEALPRRVEAPEGPRRVLASRHPRIPRGGYWRWTTATTSTWRSSAGPTGWCSSPSTGRRC